MKEDMLALTELVREMGEKYDAYITIFTFNGDSANIHCDSKENGKIDEFVTKK